ncbi:DUF4493 domain-containing protein [Parabacteroides sp. ASD2025]|uniref:DUF4493 domain-containing protein n=1 Tax=Parabacteroides sp. ASD2025 TaxID=3415987 RepID=UPI0025E1859E|nr:DUF4493 domain-containing protein [uncultured Parabacteroides sp.]
MKVLNNILFVAFATLLCMLSSCEMKKDLFGQVDKDIDDQLPIEKAGLLDLQLQPHKEADIPDSKGSISGSDVVVIDVNDFTVEILDSIGQVYKYYESYADLKKEGGLLLPVGNYSVRATLGNDVNAGFDSPFYSGTNECKITPQEVAKVITNCVLSNKKIVFRCSEEFNSSFEDDYSIVVDNGSGALTTFKDEERAAYLKNTGSLQFTIYTTTREGKKDKVYNIDLSKQEEVQEHNNILVDLDIVNDVPDDGGGSDGDDSEDEGNDEPDDPDDGDRPDEVVKAPVIKVDISLIEKDYVIEIPSDFIDGGDNGSDDPDPSDNTPTVTATLDGKAFDIKATQNVTPASKVVIQLKAPGGLESLIVKVNIGGDMMDVDLFDLDPIVAGILAGMELPKKGSTSMQTFDISPFMELLVDGINTFDVTMTDAKGVQGGGVITLNMKQ